MTEKDVKEEVFELKNEDLLESLQELSEIFNKAMKEIEEDQEQFWNSLSKEDQLKAFCAVSRRICEGEIVKRGSYRYVLYQVFGFGPESYVQAQDAGYLSIHNAIWTAEEFEKESERKQNAQL